MKTRWIFGAILGLSLAVNLLLIGMVVGSKSAERFKPVAAVAERLGPLPPERRAFVRSKFREARPELRAATQEIRRLRAEIADYIASPDFNRPEAERRFASLREKTAQAQLRSQTLLLDTAEQLSPAERRILLEKRGVR